MARCTSFLQRSISPEGQDKQREIIELVADLSINEVRRLSLTEGGPMTIELPAGRLMAFARGGGDERDG